MGRICWMCAWISWGATACADMHEVVARYVNALAAPLMLDSTNPAVMEAGLKLARGRCILNSMNLEDGEERVAQNLRDGQEIRRGGRGGDDRRGQATGDGADGGAENFDRQADSRSGGRKYGLQDEDLLFDPLVLPISTGIEEDRRNALETIEGTRRISTELPRVPYGGGIVERQFRVEAGGARGAE